MIETSMYRIRSELTNSSNMFQFYSDFPSILWLKSGTKFMYRDLTVDTLHASEALLLPANKNHFYKLTDCYSEQDLLIIELKERPCSALLYQSSKVGVDREKIIVDPGSMLFILDLILKLIEINDNNSTQKNLLNFLYSELADRGVLHHLFTSGYKSFTQRLYDYFLENDDFEYHIENTCKNLGVSRATLTRNLRNEGTRYRDVLSEYRINKAIEMMGSGSFSLLDIAISSGFNSYDTFKKHFVKNVGVVPSKYYGLIK